MYKIDRVNFVATVRWPKNGVVEALTSDMWVDCVLEPEAVHIVHESGSRIIVPWHNIRWIQASGTPQPADTNDDDDDDDDGISPSAKTMYKIMRPPAREEVTVSAPLKRKPGRPPKNKG